MISSREALDTIKEELEEHPEFIFSLKYFPAEMKWRARFIIDGEYVEYFSDSVQEAVLEVAEIKRNWNG